MAGRSKLAGQAFLVGLVFQTSSWLGEGDQARDKLAATPTHFLSHGAFLRIGAAGSVPG